MKCLKAPVLKCFHIKFIVYILRSSLFYALSCQRKCLCETRMRERVEKCLVWVSGKRERMEFLKNVLIFSLFLIPLTRSLISTLILIFSFVLWYAHIFFDARQNFFQFFIHKLVEHFLSLSQSQLTAIFNESSHLYMLLLAAWSW